MFQFFFVFSIHPHCVFLPFFGVFSDSSHAHSLRSQRLFGLYSHRPTLPFSPFFADQAPLWEEKKESLVFLVRGVGFANGLLLGPMPQVSYNFFFFFSPFGVEISKGLISKWVDLEAFSFIRIFVC